MTSGRMWGVRSQAGFVAPSVVLQQRRSFGVSSQGGVGHRFGGVAKRRAGQSQRRRPLPERYRAALEHMSGMPMGDVQVHYGSSRPDAVEAHAYTQGNQIHLAPGQEQHLAHEAWHVVQQKQRRVRPTLKVANQPVNDNSGLEREADRMALRIRSFQGRAAGPAFAGMQGNSTPAPVTQRAKQKNRVRRSGPLTRARARKNLEVSGDYNPKLILRGKRQRKGVHRYGIGDGTRTGIGGYAVSGLATRRTNRNFSKSERAAILKLGRSYGCHQCGSKNEAHFVPDHQPPLSQADRVNYRGHLFPHCKKCSSLQGGLLSKGKNK